MTTRDEHLQWCKDRALEFWRAGALMTAVVSMGSNLSKHEETKPSPFLIMAGGRCAINDDREGVKRWIDGFR